MAHTDSAPVRHGRGIDWEDLLARCMGREELARRVLNRFAETIGSELAGLEERLKGAQWDEAARTAHRMKGAAMSVSAAVLAGGVPPMEELLRDGGDAGAFDQLERLTKAAQVVVEKIRSMST